MNFKQLVRDYFTFNRSERRGITILLLLIFLLAIANKVMFKFETPARIDTALLDSVQVRLGALNDSVTANPLDKHLFSFDPNVIDSLAIDSLNIPENIKRNLIKYRSRGGKFRSREDFRKLYGMTDLIYNRVAPFLKFQQMAKDTNATVVETQIFPFDPNTASDEEFIRLGLTPRQIAAIRNYQAKAGTFKSSDDFLRIYNLTPEQKRHFAAFVKIKSGSNPEMRGDFRKPEDFLVELNTVDTLELEQLPGIGVKLSRRILKYRKLLGGFYSVSQLSEIYGLDANTLQRIQTRIKVDESKIRKLDLNFGDVGELARHPYLKKRLAVRIIQFRSKYGKIENPEILRDSMILNMEEFEKIKPYF